MYTAGTEAKKKLFVNCRSTREEATAIDDTNEMTKIYCLYGGN